MAQIIAILSGKGGTGKSLACCGIGEALAGQGKSVLLVDGSQGLRSLELFLGITDGILYAAPDLATGKCDLEDALTEDEVHPGLWLLPAAQNLPSAQDLKSTYEKALEKVAAGSENIPSFDVILLDCGGDFDSQLALATLADRVILTVTPDAAGLRAADKLRKLTQQEPEMILTRFHTRDFTDGILPPLSEIQEMLPMKIIGILEENDGLRRAVLKGESVCREMPELTNIALRLIGNEVPLPVMPEGPNTVSAGSAQISSSGRTDSSSHQEGFFRRLFRRGQK